MSFDSISCQLAFEFGTPSPQAVTVAFGTHDLTPYALVFPMGSPQSRSILRDFEPFFTLTHAWPPPAIALQPPLLATTTFQDDLPFTLNLPLLISQISIHSTVCLTSFS